MRTNELSGAALDWAVSIIEGTAFDTEEISLFIEDWEQGEFNYSSDWALAGPIIEREKIGFWAYTLDEDGNENPGWYAETFEGYCQTGTTPLIAAMRCYVASKLGDEVQLPEELK